MPAVETHTIQFELGCAPASGNDSVTQCNFFKALMRQLVGHDPDGAYLKTTAGNGRRGMAVEYDPTVPGAEEWAKQVREAAELIWRRVAQGDYPHERIVMRSKGA